MYLLSLLGQQRFLSVAIPRLAYVAIWIAVLPFASPPLSAQSDDASVSQADLSVPAAVEWLPESTIFFMHSNRLGDVVEMLLEHPLRGEFVDSPLFRQMTESDEYAQFRGGLSLVEAGIRMRWPKALKKLTEGSLCVAFDAKTESAIAIVQIPDTAFSQTLLDTVLGMVRGGQPADSDDSPVRENSYRDAATYTINDDLILCKTEQSFLLANNQDLLELVVDQMTEASVDRLADQEHFHEALSMRTPEADVWAYANVAAIRSAQPDADIYSGKTDNILAEFLFGGIVSNMQHSPAAIGELTLRQGSIDVAIRTNFSQEWIGEERSYFFGSDSTDRSPPLLQHPKRLLAASSFRNLSEMWLRSDDLLTAKASGELAQADAQLATFFSGSDFGEDILGAMESSLQIIAVQQEYERLPRPTIKIPAFGIQMQMSMPSATQPYLRRVYQNFVGFINVVGAMNGQPQFDMQQTEGDNWKMVSATYIAEKGEEQATDAPINFNFSPTVAFKDKRFILASTVDLARHLLDDSSQRTESTKEASVRDNTVVQLDAGIGLDIVRENMGQLVAQNMLENGHTKDEAEAELGAILQIVSYIKDLEIKLSTTDTTLGLGLTATVNVPNLDVAAVKETSK